jgi:hypothetical protein
VCINHRTGFRLMARPFPRSIAIVRREPRNGQVVNNSSIRQQCELLGIT